MLKASVVQSMEQAAARCEALLLGKGRFFPIIVLFDKDTYLNIP